MPDSYYEYTDQLTLHPWGVSEVRDVSAQPYHNRNDRLWKAVLDDLFEDFLCFFFPGAGQRFDLNRGIEFWDKELDQIFQPEEDAAGVRHADKLAKVPLKKGRKKYNLLHVEVQGQEGKEDFTERMHRYWYRIKDRYGLPVMSMAILTDTNRRFRPKAYAEKYPVTELIFKFTTYKVIDQDEEELRAHPSPFALVIRAAIQAGKTKRSGDQRRLAIKLDLTKEMLERNLDKDSRKGVYNFIKGIVPFKKAETKHIFEQEIQKLTGGKITMGTEEFLLEEARQEGAMKMKEKKEFSFVQSLIKDTDFDNEKIASLADVPVTLVEEVRKDLSIAK